MDPTSQARRENHNRTRRNTTDQSNHAGTSSMRGRSGGRRRRVLRSPNAGVFRPRNIVPTNTLILNGIRRRFTTVLSARPTTGPDPVVFPSPPRYTHVIETSSPVRRRRPRPTRPLVTRPPNHRQRQIRRSIKSEILKQYHFPPKGC